MARVVFQGLQIVRGVIGPVAVPKHLAQRAVILSAAGQYGDFTKADSLSLGGQLKVRDMQAIGALLDQTQPAVRPVRQYTRVSKSDEYMAFDTRLVVDKLELDGDLVAALDAEPPRLSDRVRSRNAFIPQLAERAADIPPRKKSRIISRADPVKVIGPLNNPSVEVIPWKAAVSTYGTLLFGPYIFAGVTAVDLLLGVVKKGSQESPCLDYEKRHAAGKELAR